jgi:glycosyltransferase involved in cell wall biosynthesis
MRKKILIITDNDPAQINGVVTTFQNLEIHARRDGYDIFYIDPRQFPNRGAPGYPEVRLSWPKGIGDKIQEIDPNYVHIATEGPIGFAARWWLDSHFYRYNTSYHTKFPEFLKKIYGVPAWITYAYLRWFHKHSGRVLTTTDTMVRELKEHGFRGDIRAWTRGVDRNIFDHRMRSKESGPPVLLSVGRVSREKGLDDFCEIDIPGARKIVVGDGPYRQELESRYPSIEFVGALRGTDLARYYANADVFVFASRADTFGIVIIEALAMGTPVAAYPVPGPIDILENGITGHMSEDLTESARICLGYPRDRVEQASQQWSWESCWKIFRENLVEII